MTDSWLLVDRSNANKFVLDEPSNLLHIYFHSANMLAGSDIHKPMLTENQSAISF